MKILFLSDDFPPQSFGGAGISTYDLARGMKDAGHEVCVITTCRKKSEMGEFDYGGLKIFKIASDYPERWRAYLGLYNKPTLLQLESLLKKIKPDVVHANNIHFYLSYHSLKLAKQYAKIVVFTARDAMTFSYGKLNTKKYLNDFDARVTYLDQFRQAKKRWNPFRNFFIKRYLRYPNKLFAVSKALSKALEQNGIKKVEVIYTGVRVSEWSSSNEQITNFKKKYNLNNKKIILFSGRLSESKGGYQAIKTIAEVIKREPNVVLLVVGSLDSYASAMQKKAGGLGIEKQLVFTGWIEREEIKLTYAVADVILVPSICFDALPRVVLEAMASGKPVVGTCYGGAPEIIEDNITGYIVNPFNIDEMAGKILDLFKNPEKANRFGKAGAIRVAEKFNLEKQVNRLIMEYQNEPKP